MMRLCAALLLLCTVVGCVATDANDEPGFQLADDFWKHWGDGKAELAGYRLDYPRYGAPREGVAVTIFVTETFSESAGIKHEDRRRPESDTFPAIKLNLMQDFPTGIYDYNMMTSAFVDLRDGTTAKLSFSSQEWCGHAYSQLRFGDRTIDYRSHSYFDGEGDQERALPAEAGLSEDVLLLWARGLAGPRLAPGESKRMPALRSLEHARLGHVAMAWRSATFSRSEGVESIEVPAGTFEVERLSVELDAGKATRLYPPGRGEVVEGGRLWTFWVERAAPHRLIRWSRSDGLSAELLASERLPYWSMNGPGLERELERLGLTPRAPKMP